MNSKTKERLISLFGKIIDKGLTIKQVQEMNIREYNRTFGLKVRKKKSLIGQKRLLVQIKNEPKITDFYIKEKEITNQNYQKFIKTEYRRLFVSQKRWKFGKKLQRGQYYLVHLENNGNDYFIKAENNKSFKRQLRKLQVSKGFENYKLLSIDVYSYNEFVSREMEGILQHLNIN